MSREHNLIPADEYFALYAVYVACLVARECGKQLPPRVSESMARVRAAYARHGADEYGTQREKTRVERCGDESP